MFDILITAAVPEDIEAVNLEGTPGVMDKEDAIDVCFPNEATKQNSSKVKIIIQRSCCTLKHTAPIYQINLFSSTEL